MTTPNEKVKTLQAFAEILEKQSELFTNIDLSQLHQKLSPHQSQPFDLVINLLAWCQKYDTINQALNIVISRCDMIGENQPLPQNEDPVLQDQLIDNIMVILAQKANTQTTTNNPTNSDHPDNNQ